MYKGGVHSNPYVYNMTMFCRQVTAERDRDKDYYYKEYRRESGDERMAKVTLNICPFGILNMSHFR